MPRILLLASITFVALTALGLHQAISEWLGGFDPSLAARPSQAATSAGGVAGPGRPAANGVLVVGSGDAARPSTTPLPNIEAMLLASPTPRPSSTPTIPPTPQVTPTTVPKTPAPRRVGADAPPRVAAEQYVVIDGDSGAILAEQNSHQRVAPASTTKIITALVALSRRQWSEQVIPQFDQAELTDSTLMGLKPGETTTLEDLLYGLMLPSGNDAALAIANYVAGSKTRFVQQMNDLTAEMDLSDSHWINPHGLDAAGHYSSAFDMVQFARAGMRDSRFQALAAARFRTVHVGTRTYDVFNLNRVLGQVPGADGVKIGYTEDAGRTIVASATRNGHRVFVGAFHANDLVTDTKPLFEWAFKNFSWS